MYISTFVFLFAMIHGTRNNDAIIVLNGRNRL